MKELQIKTYSVEDTMRLGERLSSLLKPGNVITLEGELGSGKTMFTKGIANGLGVKRTVTSPTFTIVKEYEGKFPLYHIDAYRLENSEEDIGFSEYFNGNAISVVEWAQFIEDFLPFKRLNITIEYLNEDSRIITLDPHGSHYEQIITSLLD